MVSAAKGFNGCKRIKKAIEHHVFPRKCSPEDLQRDANHNFSWILPE
jgi:hypothetical protein